MSIVRPRTFFLGAALFTVLSSASGAETVGRTNPTGRMTVQCAAGRSFQMEVRDRRARISLSDRNLELLRRPSSIGTSYGSDDGALMIDGDFVAFVLADDIGYRDCQLSHAIASG